MYKTVIFLESNLKKKHSSLLEKNYSFDLKLVIRTALKITAFMTIDLNKKTIQLFATYFKNSHS